MKLKECKNKGCFFLDREYNESCQQHNGKYVCMLRNEHVTQVKACPLPDCDSCRRQGSNYCGNCVGQSHSRINYYQKK